MFSSSSDINPCHSLLFDRDHLPSNMGIISGPGSFAVQYGDHLRTRTGRYPAYERIIQARRLECEKNKKLNKHLNTCSRCKVKIANGNLAYVHCCRLYRRRLVHRLVFRFISFDITSCTQLT